MTVTALATRRPDAAADTVDAVLAALALLDRTCPACTCRPAAVRDLDIDPDCPGLDMGGCLTDTHARARLALRDVGITAPESGRDRLRAALVDLPELVDTTLALAAGDPATVRHCAKGAAA